MVQGSISLKLVLFFSPPWLECHRLPIFKLFLEEVGSDRVPQVVFFFHSSHLGIKDQPVQGSVVGSRM